MERERARERMKEGPVSKMTRGVWRLVACLRCCCEPVWLVQTVRSPGERMQERSAAVLGGKVRHLAEKQYGSMVAW